jgi:hypothetical protein
VDGKDGLILWTLGGAGVLLLYAAYSNKSPRTVLAKTLGTVPAEAAPSPAPAGTAPGDTSAGSGAPATGRDASGTAYLFDADGNMAGVVPAPYQNTPQLYIPPAGSVFNA